MPLHTFPLIANSRSRQSEVLVTHQPTKVDLQNILDDKPQSLTVKTFGEIAVIVNDQAQSGKVIFAEPPPDLTLLARTYSQKPGDRQVEVTVDFPEATERYELDLTVVRLCLDVDADRDGLVDYGNPAKQTWHWGEAGQGAIYLVNSDQDWDSSGDISDFNDRRIDTVQDWQDLTPLVIRKTGLAGLPRHYDLWLVLGKNARNRVRIFEDVNTSGGRELVGPGNPAERINWRDTQTELTLALEGLRYLDQDFDGMVDVYLSLERYERPYGEDLVRLRCAPWIMTPNTLSPDTVYIAEVDNNGETVQALRPVVGLGKAQLDLVPPELNEGDRWLQDELEIGYTQTPHHRLTVCLESPRLRGLEFFPESLIGLDVGYVMRGFRSRPDPLRFLWKFGS